MTHFALLLSLALDVYPCQITLPNTAPRSLMGIGGGCGDSAQPTTPTAPEEAGVDVVEFVQDGFIISGTVKNNTTEPVTAVWVDVKIQNADGTPKRFTSLPVRPSTLQPGQTGQFSGVVTDKSDRAVTQRTRWR